MLVEMNNIDKILNELGMETPELPPINKQEAIQMGLVKGREKPKQGACGKSVYSSEANCDQAIKVRLNQGFGGTSFLRSYYCDTCAGWHMSSSHTKRNK
jgi:hypothetical protein